ncbi:MAG TPA: glycosyltransferase, partial [Chthoniobacteraceae bacterium]|nr:glycosyltransferase [Chthoniobacteraceae bacterium]
MKVVFITTNYLPFTGGVENHTASLAHSLSARHEVKVAALRFRPQSLFSRLGVLGNNLLAPRRVEDRLDGKVSVISLGPNLLERLRLWPLALRALPRIQRWFYEQLNRITRPAFLRAFTPRLRQVIAGADVVHCMAFGDLGIAAQAVANSCGIPFVCTPFVHPQQWGDGKDDVECYQRSEAVIGLTPADRDYLASLGVLPERLHIIGVAPQISEKRDAVGFRRQHGLEGFPFVLYLGRMMYKKGSRALLASARRVWDEMPEVRFVFIGPND